MSKRCKLSDVDQYELGEAARELYTNQELTRYDAPQVDEVSELMRMSWSYTHMARNAVHAWGCMARHRFGMDKHLTCRISMYILSRPGWWTPGSFHHHVYEVIWKRTVDRVDNPGVPVEDIHAEMRQRRPDATDGSLYVDLAIKMLDMEGFVYLSTPGHWKTSAKKI